MLIVDKFMFVAFYILIQLKFHALRESFEALGSLSHHRHRKNTRVCGFVVLEFI
jgi:hypothetical protein